MVKALDLFCGAGGAGWGLLNAGWDAVGVDCWGQALRVHRANVGPTLQLDLLDPRRWGELPVAKLVWASPPCQDHSAARRGQPGKGRDGWPVVAWYAKRHRPRAILVENVPGAPWVEWSHTLRGLGYHTQPQIVDAQWFGVPQTRRRGILVATLDPLPLGLVPGELVGKTGPSMGDALPLLRGIHAPKGGKQSGYLVYPQGGTVPGWLDRPAPTVTCQEVRGTRASEASGWRFNGGPDRASDAAFLACGVRRLTVEDCAILQGFPVHRWDWLDTSKQGSYKMVGNAVPPAVAEHFARLVR